MSKTVFTPSVSVSTDASVDQTIIQFYPIYRRQQPCTTLLLNFESNPTDKLCIGWSLSGCYLIKLSFTFFYLGYRNNMHIRVFPQYTKLTMLAFLYCPNFENKMDIVFRHLNFNSKHRGKCTLIVLQRVATSNLFSIEFV